MLLEAQRKLQDSGGQVDSRTPSTASVAVETGGRVRPGALNSTGSQHSWISPIISLTVLGASLLWVDPAQPLPHQELQAPPPPSSPAPPPPSSRPPSHANLPFVGPVGGGEDGDVTVQEVAVSTSGQHR